MPIYVYKCPERDCPNYGDIEYRLRIDDPHPACFVCGATMERRPTYAAVIFRGKGWTKRGGE